MDAVIRSALKRGAQKYLSRNSLFDKAVGLPRPYQR